MDNRKIVNIRLDKSVWQKAKEDAVHNQMTLQDWITLLILQGKTDKAEAAK